MEKANISITKEDFFKLQQEYNTDQKIGEQIGLNKARTRRLRLRLGIKSMFHNALPDHTREEVLRWQQMYGGDKQIAKNVGILPQRVKNLRLKFSIPPLTSFPKRNPTPFQITDSAAVFKSKNERKDYEKFQTHIKLRYSESPILAIHELKQVTKAGNWTIANFCEILGISRSSYYNKEKGK